MHCQVFLEVSALKIRAVKKDPCTMLAGSEMSSCVCVCRAINSQRFIEFTREDLQKREEKHERALKALEPQRKLLSKEDADKFFDRLINDGEKRKQNR